MQVQVQGGQVALADNAADAPGHANLDGRRVHVPVHVTVYLHPEHGDDSSP